MERDRSSGYHKHGRPDSLQQLASAPPKGAYDAEYSTALAFTTSGAGSSLAAAAWVRPSLLPHTPSPWLRWRCFFFISASASVKKSVGAAEGFDVHGDTTLHTCWAVSVVYYLNADIQVPRAVPSRCIATHQAATHCHVAHSVMARSTTYSHHLSCSPLNTTGGDA